jgi:hypothetical protein
MDMPISQVNIRLFARLPSDTGLGLLFATGTISQIVYASGERPIQFTLRHAGYALRCKIAPDLEPSFVLQEGQWVRATGHLSFSSQSAQFHLLARDLELLSDVAPARLGMAPKRAPAPAGLEVVPGWLAEVQRRAGAAADLLAPAEIPEWVQAMAPPELWTDDEASRAPWGRQRVETFLNQPDVPEIAAAESDEVWSQLLAALERSDHEDVELTAETLASFRAHAGGEADQEPRTLEPEPVAPAAEASQKELDAILTRPYGQLFLLLILAMILAVIFFLIYSLSQSGIL